MLWKGHGTDLGGFTDVTDHPILDLFVFLVFVGIRA